MEIESDEKKVELDSTIILDFDYRSCCKVKLECHNNKFKLEKVINFTCKEKRIKIHFRNYENNNPNSYVFLYSKRHLSKIDWENIVSLINENKFDLVKKLFDIKVEQYWVEEIEEK